MIYVVRSSLHSYISYTFYSITGSGSHTGTDSVPFDVNSYDWLHKVCIINNMCMQVAIPLHPCPSINITSKMMKTVAREGFKETLPGVLSRVVSFILVIYTNLTVTVVNYIIQPASWKYIGLQIGFFICGMSTMLHNHTQLNISCESVISVLILC